MKGSSTSRASMLRVLRLLLVGGGFALLGACSLLNAPTQIEFDGSMPFDAPDEGPGDADADGPDGGDGGCVDCPEICDDPEGEDEDEDGLANCADFDCAGHPACCADGGELFTERWNPASYTLHWRTYPSGEPYPQPGTTGTLLGFPTETPAGVLRIACMPLALGADILFEATPLGDETCTAVRCDRYAAIVLTAAEGARRGQRIASELSVTVGADGAAEVRLAGIDLGRITLPEFAFGDALTVRVTISPGLDARDRPTLFASVGVQNKTREGQEIVAIDNQPFLLQRELLSGDLGCEESAGLYLAVEGRGDRVRVGRLDVKRRECANPSHFRAPRRDTATLTSESLALGPFAAGGLDGPALACSCDSANCFESTTGSLRWDLLLPGTNVSPELEKFTHVGYALGHAASANWSASLGWIGSVSPKAGNDPPTCLDDPSACATALSHRDPGLLAQVDDAGQLIASVSGGLLATYVRERDPQAAGARDVFAIHVEPMSPETTEPMMGSLPVLLPGQVGCGSLRDPELIEAGRSPATDGYWLLYTCRRASQRDEIHAVWMSGILVVDRTTRRTVLTSSALGRFAENGVRGAEAVWERDARGGWLLRLWFLAEDRNGATTIGFAQGQSPEGARGKEAFPPQLLPYQGNPVLAASDPRLGPCPEGVCPLLGFDVVRRADDSRGPQAARTLRFLVARRVNRETGLETRLVPLEQSWRAPR